MEHHACRAQDLVFQLFPEQWRPFVRSGQNHLARHSERGKKMRQTEEEVGRQHQGMDGARVCQVLYGCGEKRKLEETGCEVICSAPTTLMLIDRRRRSGGFSLRWYPKTKEKESLLANTYCKPACATSPLQSLSLIHI